MFKNVKKHSHTKTGIKDETFQELKNEKESKRVPHIYKKTVQYTHKMIKTFKTDTDLLLVTLHMSGEIHSFQSHLTYAIRDSNKELSFMFILPLMTEG